MGDLLQLVTSKPAAKGISASPAFLILSCCFSAGCVGRPNWKIRPQGPERLR